MLVTVTSDDSSSQHHELSCWTHVVEMNSCQVQLLHIMPLVNYNTKYNTPHNTTHVVNTKNTVCTCMLYVTVLRFIHHHADVFSSFFSQYFWILEYLSMFWQYAPSTFS